MASLVAQTVKNLPTMQENWIRFLGRGIHWRRDRLPTPVFLGFPCSAGKQSTCNAGDLGSVPELGRYPGEGNGDPLQYSCLENSMDRGAWQAKAHGVAELDATEQISLYSTMLCVIDKIFYWFCFSGEHC